ncbi:hypothetical protein RO21_07980 [[Actinobacillus] muris]|uniref:CMP-N-acetylneuraminate-beta-galactosamide-alpha-2, 3-sialyltransferase n=1 Tax=Muribacter muris TaxID=67855 RepID=A0A0J5P6N6_9PAST|nr:glycosyltransferase family 52 [Muribacter muris]KMK51134.1 hypothetical protein RO21_07980 [[Actinobacillus] muris] [Muribacter muris]
MDIYVCLTPLQILIANYIINNNKTNCEVLILTYINNDKYKFYLNKLKKNIYVKNAEIILLENTSFINRIKTFIKIRSRINKTKKIYNDIYISSIDNFYIHYILDRIKFNKIFTFDDGTANIIKNSFFYKKSSTISIIGRKVLNIKWDINTIKRNSNKHFTIYNNLENIISNVEFIDIFSPKNTVSVIKDIHIFLGQPFKDDYASVDIYNKLVNKLNKKMQYYPHPRETGIEFKIDPNNLIYSNLIIEEYIESLLKKGIVVNLYTISSSAGFNLYYSKNVNVLFIFSSRIDKEVSNIYNLIKQKKLANINLD